MFTNSFNGLRAAAESFLGITNPDVRASFFASWSSASDTPTPTNSLLIPPPAPPANAMSLQTDDAGPQSPSGPDLPPNPFLDKSSSTPKPSRAFIDLSSPTRPSSRSRRRESHSEMPRPRQHTTRRSEDEKRLVGDYSRPADAIDMPDPSTWCPKKRAMATKPGSNSGFKPVDTMHTGPKARARKPFTYGKHNRPHPQLIGQGPGAGQIAYVQQRDNKAPATTAPHASFQETHDRRSGGAMPGKRRKTDDVISLVDDDDEVLEISRPDHGSPAGASRDRPCSAWSLHSHMSNGSESTMGDVKPPQATSEFREADSLLRPSQKKPRSSNSNTSKRGVRHSPFAGGSLSISPGADTTRRNILQSFQQGEAKQSPVKNDSAGRKGDILTSKFFPDARINESTSDQIEDNLRVKVDNEDLRAQHRPVPKQSGSIIDSYSADELAITPPRQATKFSSRHKQQQTANSGAKRDIRKRVVEELWPLSFARSYEFEGFGSTSNDGHATLVLRWKKDEGLRVQTWDPVDGIYDCKIIIQPKDVNKICADDTSRIRLLGPRRHDGSVLSLDLEFADTDDFLVFRNDHAVLMTLGGKLVAKSEDHMARLFQTPLQPRNEKAGTSALVHDSTASLEKSHREKGHVVSKTPLMDQLKHAAHQPKSDAKPDAITASEALTRPVRARRSAPISYINDTATQVDVSKFSVETGLGQPWTRSLEFGEGRQRAIVHFDDLPRLDEEEFLNDSLIDFYMIYLFKQLKVPADKVYFFNTYFFTRLTENSGRKSMDYKAVERWTSKIDIFSYDYIVVPINEQAHWYLAIICNMSKIERKAIVQDFEANAPNQAITSATTTTSTENEKKTTQKSALSTGPTATAERLAPPNEEDPNLFDEAALSFVDRDDAGTGVPPESGTTQAESGRQNQQTECLAVTDTTDAQPETSSQSQFATSSTKKKAKRRPVPKRDPDQPVIIVLDSLGGNARTGAVRALKDWIAAEGFNRRGMEAVIKENGYYPKSSQVPMQNNFTDCGVYLLGYIEKFFQNPDDFKDKLLTGSMSAQEDWPELDPSEMRHKMRQIIFDCYKKQEDDRRAQRKAKKISASSKTSPTATPHKPTNLGRRDSEGSQNGRPKLKSPSHKDGAQPASPQTHSPARPPARLGSPFSFDAEHAPSAKQSPQAAVSKVSDSPPVLASPVKQAISTPQPEATPRRHSPNIRNSSRTPQSDGPLRNGKITLNQTPRSIQANQQTSHISSTSSPKKRRRQGDGSDEVKSPTAKRQFTGSPQRNQNSNAESKKSASRSREGSVPNAPIEINDSQEVQVIDVDHRQQAQPSSFAQRKPPSRHPHPREGLRPSPTFEGDTHSSSSFKTSKHGQHEGTPVDGALRTKLDEDDHARDNVQRSRAPNPSEGIGALESREEILDPVAGISQSTHDLQLDGVNDGSVVEETPEPEETSTAVQTGWSRDNPLLL